MDIKQFAGKTFNLDDLAGMTQDERDTLLAIPNIVMHGTGVVRKADGYIRYDCDAEPGAFHENIKDMVVI